MIRIAIVDDHPVARWGLEHLAATEPDLTVATCVHRVDELDLTLEWDVLVLDLYMGDSRVSPEQIGRCAAKGPVLTFSASSRPADVQAALRSGATGYVTKDSPDEMLVQAIHAVAAGGVFLSPAVAAAVRKEEVTAPPLSSREEEALIHIAQGFTHRQAAHRMGIAVTTFDSHLERVRNKLGVGNKAALTSRAIAMGLVSEDVDHSH